MPPTKNYLSAYKAHYSYPSPRTTVPLKLMDPACGDQLQTTIMELWRSSEPTRERKDAMEELRLLLTNAVNAAFSSESLDIENGKMRFEVDIVGSTSWGGEIGTSTDVDLVIIDRNFPRGYEPSVWLQPPDSTKPLSFKQLSEIRYHASTNPLLPGCYSLKALSDCMEGVGMTHTVRSPHRLPLLKFVDPVRKLGCDLQCNDLSGMYNCSLILAYTRIAPYVLLPMICTLKTWYKVKSGKDPKMGNKDNRFKLSSYAICLMSIAYLQNIGHLPNLQKDIRARVYNDKTKRLEDEELVWVEWGRNRGLPAHTSFSKVPDPNWRPTDPDLTVCRAVIGFLRYFSGRIETNGNPEIVNTLEKDHFDPCLQVISPLNGGIMPREGTWAKRIQPTSWIPEKLVIQDSFKWAKNQAASMTELVCDQFFQCIRDTSRILEELGNEARVEDILRCGL
ncbi:uncharacterized protein I303_100545 [Kwoniella dejecticola CBS 10117]|uniref:Poly(A) RNA polymerase mitochondrial-like central palm domain-containing protein n=1 Tax=Kwoniella dejecticola CBS 10117 TaxID=1296121 RepID=A0AAJ8KI98_9TREE